MTFAEYVAHRKAGSWSDKYTKEETDKLVADYEKSLVVNQDRALFDDDFGAWLEAHGVVLGGVLEAKGWRCHIDLNILKAAIVELSDDTK